MGARSTSFGHRHAHHQELKELKRSNKGELKNVDNGEGHTLKAA